MLIRVTRRTVAYTRPQTGTRLQRLAAGVLLVPVLIVVLALATLLLVLMLVITLFFSLVLALTAIFARRRLLRAR
jgi:hypothetical protein